MQSEKVYAKQKIHKLDLEYTVSDYGSVEAFNQYLTEKLCNRIMYTVLSEYKLPVTIAFGELVRKYVREGIIEYSLVAKVMVEDENQRDN